MADGEAGQAADAELRADASAPIARPKAIILFSDGTGNSSAKLFKTNVFRLYEALDLGLDPDGECTQIAYYDNGVGTSSVRLLAVLGGVFGFGLKRNIIHLYRFLCRNYNDGDRIFAFGFSRGAFTIRLLVALIGSQGIVPYDDERELARNTADAYRRFASANSPDFFPWIARGVRFVRDGIIKASRRWRPTPLPFDAPAQYRPDIEFVGVWDTVAAYGGPVAEITRAIDQWIWPLTMTDYQLGPRVKTARHALALDDERDSFLPLLWNEVHEERQANNADLSAELRERYATRLKQVWFVGMHSDVGGGYPDDSLSYVSLAWMIDELGDRLQFLETSRDHIRAFANVFGPMHDSRAGMGGYFRYQPRKIAAFLHPRAHDLQPLHETLVLRDPTIGEKIFRPQGLLLSCRVHESVLVRIGAGNDNYAPIVLPRDITIEPMRVERTELEDDTAPRRGRPDGAGIGQLLVPEIAQARAERQEAVWDFVWWRRGAYFLTVALTLLLVASPLWIAGMPPIPESTDGRWVLGSVIGLIGYLVPAIARAWFDAFAEGPAYFVLLGVPILIVRRISTALERVMSDRTRRLWWSAMKGPIADLPVDTRLRRIRNAKAYQWPLQQIKWRVLPFLVGVSMVAALPYGASILYVQAWLAQNERRDVFCRDDAIAPPFLEGSTIRGGFRAGATCNRTGVSVYKDHRYRLTFHGAGWRDGGAAVPLAGKASLDYANPLPMLLGMAYRRVVPARWLEPLIEIRGDVAEGRGKLPPIDIDQLSPTDKGKTGGVFAGEFVARQSGALHLFLNDAVLPFGAAASRYGPDPRYADTGTATVLIEDLTAPDEPPR